MVRKLESLGLVEPDGPNWRSLALDQGIEETCSMINAGSAVIVDDWMLHHSNKLSPIGYFLSMLEVLVHYRVTINLQKGKYQIKALSTHLTHLRNSKRRRIPLANPRLSSLHTS